MAIVAGVDTSTQSCTVQLRDADTGRLLGVGRTPHPPTTPPVSEQDPRDWWSAFTVALRAAVADAGVPAREINAISVDGQCHGMVALDERDEVIRPAKLWNDTTSAPQTQRLVETLGKPEWARRTGLVPTAALTITKLAWLAENEPANFGRLRRVLLPHDYLTWRLSGRAVTDRSDASGTGYFSAAENRWLPDLLALVDADRDWTDALPEVSHPDTAIGTVTALAAAETGLAVGTVIGPGAGDQHAGALGLGVADADLGFSLGTSGVVLTHSTEPVHDETGMVDGVADATGDFLPLVCTLNCTQVTDLFASLLGVDHGGLAALALATPPEHAPPVLAPFLAGERSPDLPHARGLLGGLSLTTTREDLARSAFEGVLLGLLSGADALRGLGLRIDGRTLVTGGGSRSGAYTQLLADLSGRVVTVLDIPDASARGACVQAAAVLTHARTGDVACAWAPKAQRDVEPRPGAAPDHVRARHAELAEWPGHTVPWEGTR